MHGGKQAEEKERRTERRLPDTARELPFDL